MKRLLSCFAILISTTTAFAQGGFGSGGSSNVQGYLGFNQTAPIFGVEYEAPQQFGGYFIYQAEEDDLVPQIMAFGAFMKAHFSSGSFDAYVAPGFGFGMYNDDRENREDIDETFFGPSFRVGALYQLSPGVGIGLENAGLYNWMSDEIGGVYLFTMLTVRVAL